VLLRAIAVGDQGFKLATVASAQLNIRSLAHPPDSYTRALQGIPKRIQVLDLVPQLTEEGPLLDADSQIGLVWREFGFPQLFVARTASTEWKIFDAARQWRM
jgi:hypothetical protein